MGSTPRVLDTLIKAFSGGQTSQNVRARVLDLEDWI